MTDGTAPPYIDKQHPTAYRALIRVAQAARDAAAEVGLDRRLIELVNLRASQLNGCAACLDIHTRAAEREGETMQRIALLPAWREVSLYDDRERAALGLAEALTRPHEGGLHEAQRAAAEHLTTEQLSAIEWIIVAINAFNRVSIASRHPVAPRPAAPTSNPQPKEDAMESTVINNAEASRYEVHFDGKLAGFADYRLRADRIIFTHTEIDDAFGGKGLGSVLARGALDDVRANGELQVVPLCPFIKGWIAKHPDYQDLVAADA